MILWYGCWFYIHKYQSSFKDFLLLLDNVRHCRYCVSHHASREFQYSCFIFLSKLTRFLLWVLYFVASCVTWVTLLYSDSCVTWHLTLYLNLYNVRILLCHVRCSVQGNVQCRVPRKINRKNNVLHWHFKVWFLQLFVLKL